MKAWQFSISLAIIISLLFLCCTAPTKKFANGEYKIDPAIRGTVDSATNTTRYDTFTTWDFAVFRNNKWVYDTTREEILTYASLHSDTLILVGASRNYLSSGYRIKIYDDTCVVAYRTRTTEDSGSGYRLKPEDELVWDILVPCNYQLVLAEEPDMEAGQLIEGSITLITDNYYALYDGEEVNGRIALKAYFRTKAMTGSNF